MAAKSKRSAALEIAQSQPKRKGLVFRDGFYRIRRSVNGHRYDVSTRTTTYDAALEQLRVFETDPEGYDPRGKVKPEGIYLTVELRREFLKWSEDVKKNSAKWVNDQRLYLNFWADALKNVDLRQADLKTDVDPHLTHSDWSTNQKRTAVLKRFYSWLRTVKRLIKTQEDPTWGQLMVPASVPSEGRHMDTQHLRLMLKVIDPAFRDDLMVLAGTGWHFTELERYVAAGHEERHPINGKPVLVTWAKAKRSHPTEVSQDVFKAAQRTRLKRQVDYQGVEDKQVPKVQSYRRKAFQEAMEAATEAIRATRPGVTFKDHGPGDLRHTVSTYAGNMGASAEARGDFVGNDAKTNSKFYSATVPTKRPVGRKVPKKVPTPV